MTLSAGPGPVSTPQDPDGAPLAVAVGRSIGGILLTILGAAIILGAVFLLFVAPFLGPDWEVWIYSTDHFWVPVAIGGAIALWGVTLVRRARKMRLEEPGTIPTTAITPEETP
jgi:peptidoglycan/LPS O-acetylase OafA/YrhL